MCERNVVSFIKKKTSAYDTMAMIPSANADQFALHNTCEVSMMGGHKGIFK